MAKAQAAPVDEKKVVQVFRMFSDETRLKIAVMLSEREHFVGEICDGLGVSQPAISHHLALLRVSGMIEARRQGKNNFYSLSPEGEWVVAFAQRLSER